MQSQQQIHSAPLPEDPPFSFRAELGKVFSAIGYALSKWRLLLAAAVIGSLLGIGYSWIKPVDYSAVTTFIVEESKLSGSGGIASALAGQLGFDIGSLTGASSGMLAGDNVQELVKSHRLIRKTLLSPYDSSGRSLADVFMHTKKWDKKWAGQIGHAIRFPVNATALPRTEDSLLQKITTKLIESNLDIGKPDKKLAFFRITFTTGDEKLSLLFNQRLLKAAADFYIDTKTRRLSNNVKRLQAKADSLAIALNNKTYSAAEQNRNLLDANPAFVQAGASSEIMFRDKYMQGQIYAEIVKNLEVSKTALIQETPTIQVVDDPEIPLKDNKIRWWIAALAGAMITALAAGLGVIAARK